MIDIHAVMKIVNTRKGLSFQPIEAQSPYIAMYMGEYSPYGFLKIGFQSSFPYSLPSVIVIDPTTHRLHVDEEGKICIAHESSLLLNTNMPDQIVIDALQLAEQVLSLKPGTPEYAAELKKEFLSYWGKGDRGTTIWSIFSIQRSEIIQQVPLFYHNKSYILAPSLADANSFMQDHCGFPPVINKREMAWIIPLKKMLQCLLHIINILGLI